MKVTVITGDESCFKPDAWVKVQSAMELLQNNHVQVNCVSKVYHRFAVIDKQLVWYGGINFLGFDKAAQGAMRLHCQESAVELRSIYFPLD